MYWLGWVFLAIFLYVLAYALFTSLVRRYVIHDYEVGVKFVHGRFAGELGPGRHFVIAGNSRVQVVTKRLRFDILRGQEILSQDGVTLGISLLVVYAVGDAHKAVTVVEDFAQALHLTAQEELRRLVAALPIDDVLLQRDDIAAKLQELLAARVAPFGLEISSIGIRDLMFSGQLKQTFAAAVTARKEATASLERARGEQATLRSLANTARMLDGNPSLFQLRLLESLGQSSGHTIVLGLPGEALRSGASPTSAEAASTADA